MQREVEGLLDPLVRLSVNLVGTPAMWFIAVPVLAWAVWRTFVKRDWRYAAALVGYAEDAAPDLRKALLGAK